MHINKQDGGKFYVVGRRVAYEQFFEMWTNFERLEVHGCATPSDSYLKLNPQQFEVEL